MKEGEKIEVGRGREAKQLGRKYYEAELEGKLEMGKRDKVIKILINSLFSRTNRIGMGVR